MLINHFIQHTIIVRDDVRPISPHGTNYTNYHQQRVFKPIKQLDNCPKKRMVSWIRWADLHDHKFFSCLCLFCWMLISLHLVVADDLFYSVALVQCFAIVAVLIHMIRGRISLVIFRLDNSIFWLLLVTRIILSRKFRLEFAPKFVGIRTKYWSVLTICLIEMHDSTILRSWYYNANYIVYLVLYITSSLIWPDILDKPYWRNRSHLRGLRSLVRAWLRLISTDLCEVLCCSGRLKKSLRWSISEN